MVYLMILGEKNMDYSKMKASPLIRIGAAAIDLMLTLFLYFIFSSLVIGLIIGSSNSYTKNYNVYKEALVSTGLYVDVENDFNTILVNFDFEKVEKYDDTITNFYTYNFEDKLTDYQNSKKDYPKLFSYNEETKQYVISGDVSKSEEYNKFFQKSIANATTIYLNSDEVARNAYQQLRILSTINQISSLVASILITYLLFPMIFKYGETLGKKIFGLRVVSVKGTDFKVSKLQVFVRFCCYGIVEIVVSLFTYGIPLLISTIIMCATKNKSAIHDFAAQTLVLDKMKIQKVENTNEIVDKRVEVGDSK